MTGSIYLREVLVAMAVTHMAIGYPSSGTQLSCGGVLFILAALSACHSGLRDHFGAGAPEKAAIISALMAVVIPTVAAVDTFRANTRLDLPGAQWLRLDPPLAAQLQESASVLRANGGPFITVFGLNSMYLWTGMAPPTPANATLWPQMLNAKEQLAIVTALERDENSAVLVASGGEYINRGATNCVLGQWIVTRTAPSSEIGPGRWPLRKRIDH